jgi:hypothetical protein
MKKKGFSWFTPLEITSTNRKTKFLTGLIEKLNQWIKRKPKSEIPKIYKTPSEFPIKEEKTPEEAKYFTGPTPPQRKSEMPYELPSGYGGDKIVLQTRDPWWVHAYWEITEQTKKRLGQDLGEDWWKLKRLLRIYDVSEIIFDGTNARSFFDIEVTPEANNWYIHTNNPGRSFCVDLGLFTPDNRFLTVARSNAVSTPISGPSWITDEEWMIPEEAFSRLYGMSVGLGVGLSSPELKRRLEERLKQELASGALASVGLFSPARRIEERKFWLIVNTELILYGATEPDAQLTVQGRTVKLNRDGTFSLRFALPDGKQVIPVSARSSDGKEEKTITPIVTKKTI